MYKIEIPREIFENIYFQEGGKFKEVLTGEFTAEDQTAKDEDVVAELEHGEYMMTPEGNVTKAIGEKHSNGGIELTDKQIPDGTKIISDHLKVEKSAKDLAKKYDIKVNPTDTYAKVLDKWTKKSGLQDLVDEELEIIKGVEKQAKKLIEFPEREATIALNIETLQHELKEIQEKKAPLEEQRKPVFEEVFIIQEASKPKKETTQKMQAGGTFNGDIIAEYAKKHNISTERAKELVGIYERGGYYQDAGTHNKGRLNDWYSELEDRGYMGKEEVGAMQDWMAENYPDEVISYFTNSGQPMTAKHIDLLKASQKDVFTKAGINPNKASAAYTPEEKQKLVQNATLDNNFWIEGFKDQKWDWRRPVLPVSLLSERGQSPYGKMVAPLPLSGETPQLIEDNKQPSAENIAPPKSGNTNKGMLLLPDQTPLLPDSLQPAVKITRRFDRVDAPNYSPDAMISEIRRQERTAMEATNSLPDAQRASAIAQIQANTASEISKAMGMIQIQNMQGKTQTDAMNAQVQMAEENARQQDVLSYENRIFSADAKTQANLRNYYNTLNKINVGNYNTIQSLNMLNAMTPNQAFTGDEVVTTNMAELPNFNGVSTQTNAQKIEEAKALEKQRKATLAKNKKKSGGRFKK